MKPTTPFPSDAASYAEAAQRDSIFARDRIDDSYAVPGELVLAEPVIADGLIVSLTLLVGYSSGAGPVVNEVEVRVYDCKNDVLTLSSSQHLKVDATSRLQTLTLSKPLAVSTGQYIGLRYQQELNTGAGVVPFVAFKGSKHSFLYFEADPAERTKANGYPSPFNWPGWHVNITAPETGGGDAPTARPFQKANINRPAARMAHRLATLVGTGNSIPAGARQNAAEQVEQMHAAQPQPRTMVAGVPSGLATAGPHRVPIGTSAGLHFDNSGWTSLGPHKVGGRTRAIVFDPKNPNRIFAGSAGGGVWISEDQGMTWFPTEDLMGNLAVASLAIDLNTRKVFAGTGEVLDNRSGMPGEGIFWSHDGWSWELIPATKVTAADTRFQHVTALAITSDGKVMLAGTSQGIHRLEWKLGSEKWDWAVVKTTFPSVQIYNLYLDPRNSSNAIASTFAGETCYSTDGGITWTPSNIQQNNAAVSICYAAAKDNLVYAVRDMGFGINDEIWKSTDGGKTFELCGATADIFVKQGNYDNVIWAGDPRDEKLILLGGIDLWRSTDGGKTVTQISTWSSDQSAHADQHVIVADPDYDGVNKRRVYFGNDGGIYKTEDVSTVGNNATEPYTNGWVNLNNGYGVTQFYGVAAHTGTRIVIAGAQDNGTRGHTPGEFFWDTQKVTGGDGGYVAADQNNSGLFYGEYVFGLVTRSDRSVDSAGEVTWEPMNITRGDVYELDAHGKLTGNGWWGLQPLPYKIPEAFVPDANRRIPLAEFIAPFVLDPMDNGVMLVGCTKLWRTKKASEPVRGWGATGPRWESIKSDNGDGTITAIATGSSLGAGQASNIILVGHVNGAIYLTANGDVADDQIALDAKPSVPIWEKINTPIVGRCNCLAIDPRYPDKTFYAGFGNFEPGRLQKTINGGTTWETSSGTAPLALPEAPIYAITLHPKNPDWVYVGFEYGVFASEDGGETWAATNEGPANVPCYGFTWIEQTLLVATHGRGVFQIDLTDREQPKALLFGDVSGVLQRIDMADPTAKSTSKPISVDRPLGDLLVVDAEAAKTIGDAYGNAETATSPGDAYAPDYEKALSGRAFMGDGSGKVYCVDAEAETLEQLWTTPPVVSGDVHVSPAIWACSSRDMVYLLVVTDAGKLHLLDPVNCKELHKLHPSDREDKWPVVLAGFGVNDKVWSCAVMDDWTYIASTCGTYAVRLHPDAMVEWHHSASKSTQPPLMAANSCFVSGTDGNLYALKARTDNPNGEEVWSPRATGARITTMPAWSVGAVVVGNANGRLVGFDHRNGCELFEWPPRGGESRGGEVQSLGADDSHVYWVGSDSEGAAYLHRLDVTPRTGDAETWGAHENWRKLLRGGCSRSPLIFENDLYLLTTLGELHQVSTDGGADDLRAALCPPVVSVKPVIDMVWIPTGHALMGSVSRAFWMGKYPVTASEYASVMGLAAPPPTKASWPADTLSWKDAVEYCTKLTKREQATKKIPADWEYRLPTENEWEYACRAGTTTEFSYGDDDAAGGYQSLSRFAWYASTGGVTPQPMGQKLPNPWGLYDMHGNVWEWCQDRFVEDNPPMGPQNHPVSNPGPMYSVYETPPTPPPVPPNPGDPEEYYRELFPHILGLSSSVAVSGSLASSRYSFLSLSACRVVRGGCWHDAAAECRSASRGALYADDKTDGAGFRVVLTRKY